jgi:cell wall-associated NlpC family hydrolase
MSDSQDRRMGRDSYRMGRPGPTTWDCSSLTQAAYAEIGVKMPVPPSRNPAGWPPATGLASNPAKKTRRPNLLGLLPRTQPDRTRHTPATPPAGRNCAQVARGDLGGNVVQG